MAAYDSRDDELSAVAGSCRHMKYRNSVSGASEAYGNFSCSMCSYWDGADCKKKVFNSLLSKQN